MNVCSFSDVSFNITSCQIYGQTGIITGLAFDVNGEGRRIFHQIHWSSCKQRRVSYSSYGTEIFLCSDADDHGYYVKQAVQTIFDDNNIKKELNVDSNGLYATITTLHEGIEYCLRKNVQRIRDSFEAEELDVLKWTQCLANISDALTMHNTNSYRLMSQFLSADTLDLPRNESYYLDSLQWK